MFQELPMPLLELPEWLAGEYCVVQPWQALHVPHTHLPCETQSQVETGSPQRMPNTSSTHQIYIPWSTLETLIWIAYGGLSLASLFPSVPQVFGELSGPEVFTSLNSGWLPDSPPGP